MVTSLTKLYSVPMIGKICQKINSLIGCNIPIEVHIGSNVVFVHNAIGTVIHEKTFISDNVKIYQDVTIGRGDIWKDPDDDFKGFIIDEGAILCAGAKIISSHGKLRVGRNTVIGANAVLTKSTGDNEIWGGIPAKRLKLRNIVHI